METSKPTASIPRLTDLFGSVLLPVPLKPLENELFSSWFVRVARANGLRCHQLARILTGRGRQLFIGDIDRGIWKEPIFRLADLIGVSRNSAEATLLSSYEPFLWTENKRRGVWPFILPMSTKDHGERRHGLQYCPLCLASDTVPYFRKHWRLAFTVACEVHGVYLKDCCPSCNAPICIERGDIKHSRFQDIPTIGQCARCKCSLSETTTVIIPIELLDRQKLILVALHRGWVNISGRVIYSHLYFHGIRMLLSFLDDSRYSEKLYAHLILSVNISLSGPFSSGYRYGGIEQCDLVRRIELVKALDWMLTDWPERCTPELQALNFNSTSIFRFNGGSLTPIPFWLWEPVWEKLNKSMYVPSIEEIQNACRYLFKLRKQPSMRELCNFLNLSTLYSYRIAKIWRKAINDFPNEVIHI